MQFEFRCPFDGCQLSVPADAIGTRIIHDGCGSSLHVPFALANSRTIFNQAIQRSWFKLMEDCGAKSGDQIAVFAQLLWAYAGEDRHYHNLSHIVSMLDIINSALNVELTKLIQEPTLELATWFHDAVYDTHSHENESRSAQFALESQRSLGINESCCQRVRDLILMTAKHEAPEDDTDAWLFLDADLSILSESESEYARYSQAIRKEYHWVEEKAYLDARKKVLSRFLSRPRIYRSDRVGNFRNFISRRNLTREIAEIDAKLRTLA